MARVAAGISGLLLLAAAILSWWVHPAITAVLVGLAVVVMSAWQVYRRRAGIEPMAAGWWTTYVGPLTFGALAVIALNGWIYRISADAGSDSGELQMLIGLITGVVGMAAAYGYGRLRAQRAQLGEIARPEDDEQDDQQWFFPQAK
ncbi:hypothetical protein [Gordonia neofelifaecis]|uniref:Transmembrane protein n=1 Tax=Gordonia neofelifaecis NRRL B-59395 TaxID=644548 RepID=F1YIF1_9ACTN|nr:hypothetical protein [Gordonia neofelifaecis]EGD55705.1 hypothetical protein SCNU_08328 [Gordonia neofelifaecis NRRL B-59395]